MSLKCLLLPPAGTNSAHKTLSYNPAENAVLLTSDVEGGSYELHILPKDAGRGETVSVTPPPLVSSPCLFLEHDCLNLVSQAVLWGCGEGLKWLCL